MRIDSRQAAGLGMLAVTHSESNAIRQILQHSWRHVFGKHACDEHACDEQAARDLLKLYMSSNPWDWTNSSMPSYEYSVDITTNSKDSMPGGDGVFNAAWKHGGKFAHESQYNFFQGQCAGKDPGEGYNNGHWVSPPRREPTFPILPLSK